MFVHHKNTELNIQSSMSMFKRRFIIYCGNRFKLRTRYLLFMPYNFVETDKIHSKQDYGINSYKFHNLF